MNPPNDCSFAFGARSAIILAEFNTQRLAAEIANHARWARATPAERRQQGEVMRAARKAAFLRLIDPDSQLSEADADLAWDHEQHRQTAAMRLAKAKKQERRERGKAHE